MNEKCTGFQWIGQSFDNCDGCGRDIRDHEGLDWLKPGASPFAPLDEARELVPFGEAMERVPLFAHYVTPIGGGGPYRWERSE
jgi:hypothetical protein